MPLRGRKTPRERARQLPAPFLDQGPLPSPATCPTRQEHPAEVAAGGKEVKSGCPYR
jgi:hypothetical protein